MSTTDTSTTGRSRPAARQALTAIRFVLRNQVRNRLAGMLLVVFVPVWYPVMLAMTGHRPLTFRLFATGRPLTVDGGHLTLITAGLNALTMIVGFAVFHAVHISLAFDRRLVFAGYRQATLIAAKAFAVLVAAAGTAVYAALVLLVFWRPDVASWLAVVAAFTVIGLTYGALGVLVRGDLEGFLPDHHGQHAGHVPAEPARQPAGQQADPAMVPVVRADAVRRRPRVRAHHTLGPPRPRVVWAAAFTAVGLLVFRLRTRSRRPAEPTAGPVPSGPAAA